MKTSILAAGIMLAAVAGNAHAGLKLPSLTKSSDAAASSTPAPSGDALIVAFQASQGSVIAAQHALATALDLKAEVAKLDAESKRYGSGQLDLDAMKKSREISAAAQAVIDAKIAEKPVLTAAQREQFTGGLVHYGKALIGARELVLQAQQFTSSVGSNPMALMGKARTALWVGKETPGYVKGLGTTTRQLFSFAKSSGIKPPANATAALDDL
jgi:hypothetical protein